MIFNLSIHQPIQFLNHMPQKPLAIFQEIQFVPQQEVSMINIPTLYFYRYDLYKISHETTSLCRDNRQLSITISHAYIKIQLFIKIRHTF
jgi:hypothetical protein